MGAISVPLLQALTLMKGLPSSLSLQEDLSLMPPVPASGPKTHPHASCC